MADDEALYRELRSDLERVSGLLFELAQQHVRKRAGFVPFGATLDRAGAVALYAATTGEDLVSPVEVLPLLQAGLRKAAAHSDVAAVAVCEWVKITPSGSPQTDAIKVLVEHVRGLTIAFYVPCGRRLLGGWRFEDALARSAAPEVQPWGKSDAAEQALEADGASRRRPD